MSESTKNAGRSMASKAQIAPGGQKGDPFDEATKQQLRDDLGRRIKMLRTDQGLTLEAIAGRSGLAVSTIYKVENGRVSPSYENLVRLARGLGVGLEHLFEAESSSGAKPTRMTVTRSGEGKSVTGQRYGYQVLCNALTGKRIIPMVATIPAGTSLTAQDLDAHEGEETLFVLKGQVELTVELYQPVVLDVGDCVYFDSTLRHGLRALGADDAQVFWACTHVEGIG